MATFLFWNLNGKALMQEVAQLCNIYSVDVLVLAEAEFSEPHLQIELDKTTGHVYIAPDNIISAQIASKLKFFFRYSQDSIRWISDYYGVSIREISLPLGPSILLVAVHLNSKRNAPDNEQDAQARLAVHKIEEAEKNVGHTRTLVIGDFNMNPFQGGMVDADAFHGVMLQNIAKRKIRNIQKIKRKFFYNPMWSRMGDISDGPPGTYYYNKYKNREFFWYTFDQILIRPDLLTYFHKDNLKVIDAIGEKQLLRKNRINSSIYSDHLPILFKLSIEEEI